MQKNLSYIAENKGCMATKPNLHESRKRAEEKEKKSCKKITDQQVQQYVQVFTYIQVGLKKTHPNT